VAKKEIKVGVQAGSGAPRTYLWNVYILDIGFKEADQVFNQAQYRHLALQVQEMARERQPSRCRTVDVQPIEDFYELRDRGGVLGSLNARVYLGIDHDTHSIVALGAIHKQNNGPTPIGDKVRMRRRWRKYLKGDYGSVSG
jgi:hypothetical protein